MRRIRMCVLVTIFFVSGACAVAQSFAIDKAITDLKDPDSATRANAARLLWDKSAENPDQVKAAIPALAEAVLDRNLNVRFMVMIALQKLGPASKIAVPMLIKALDTFPGGTPPLDGPPRYYADARWAACDALGAIGPDARDAIPALQQSLKDPSADVRKSAAEALKKVRGR